MNGVVLANPTLKAFWQEAQLQAVDALDERPMKSSGPQWQDSSWLAISYSQGRNEPNDGKKDWLSSAQ
jgi:hypothetical protein